MKSYARHSGYRYVDVPNRGKVYEHVLVVEEALGHQLPEGAVVHHVDEFGGNNAKTNLVACQDKGYHLLLHRRQKALNSCGDANKVCCRHCKQWDSATNMKVFQLRSKDGSPNGWNAYHRRCHTEAARKVG